MKVSLLYPVLKSQIKKLKIIPAPAFLLLAAGAVAAMSGVYLLASAAQNETKSPHGAIQIRCMNCHRASGWSPIRSFPEFDHSKTGFAIKGMHAGLDCRSCHVTLVFSDAGTGCADCHADIHRLQFGRNCEQCHSTRGWREVVRTVSGHESRFPLFGAHAAVQCEGCHKSAAVGLYRGLSTDCAFCHISDYANAASPDHKSLGYSTKCDTCHAADSWLNNFDHTRSTGFPLVGAHAQLDCAQCHIEGNFSGAQPDCSSCHLESYTSATNPNHIVSGFPQDCSACHSTSAWTPAFFNHSGTSFPLTGAHVNKPCTACHSSGQYQNLPSECVSCHLAQYNRTTNPNHVTAAYPQNCSVCHGTTAWIPSTLNHQTTRFPLTGKHTTVQCASCHISGVYAGTPTDCYSCHSKEYSSVTDPNHAAAGFSRDCSQCHTTTGWSGAVFNHTKFPIYSGTHARRWTNCGECHTNSSNYAVFTCFSCHEHNKTDMDSEHRGVSNYIYNSANCYSCHPAGRAG